MHSLTARTKHSVKKSYGFTLIEIMVVVVILGILAALVVPKIMSRPDDARVTKVRQDVQAISAALELYRLDNFVYPDTDEGLEALVSIPASNPKNWKQGGYLASAPTDPWGNPYLYLSPGTRGEFDLYSLGSDGQPGGTGAASDIGNWPQEN